MKLEDKEQAIKAIEKEIKEQKEIWKKNCPYSDKEVTMYIFTMIKAKQVIRELPEN